MNKEREEKKQQDNIFLLAVLSLTVLLALTLVLATPTGPTSINITSNTTKATVAGAMVNISGGYISKVNVTATVQNPHWKAFVGWINGRFTLTDATGSQIYDWTLTTISGEIYATRNSSTISWGSIRCANITNITTEENALVHNGADNISSTFSGTNANTFVTAGQTISAGACRATNTYVNNATQSAVFEEVILYDGVSIVFASVLEDNEAGYDGSGYDFQLLAPENASQTWAGATAYYLYVEIS